MRKNYTLSKAFALVFSLFIVVSSCRKEEEFLDTPEATEDIEERYPPQLYNSDVAQQWYALLLQLIKETPGHAPPVSARELGYTGITLYETVAAGIQGNKTLAGQLVGLSTLPARKKGQHTIPVVSANAALARIIKNMMGNASAVNVARIDSLELANEQYYASLYDPADVTRSVNFGRAIADAIYNWSLTDGGHQGYLNLFPASYVPPTGPGMWVPTPPLFQSALLPYWGNNRVFVAANGSSLIDPPLPPPYSTVVGSDFYNAALEVYNTGINLTQTQMDIATFWANGGGTITPPGHSIAVTAQIIRNENLNLKEAAQLLAKVGISQNDAAIVCWRAKFSQNLLRPITYIQANIDPVWTSFIGTPPFPSYTSGHSTFSASAAKILTEHFGNNYAFNDSSKVSAGLAVRSYSSFEQAAQEAAVSRLYGGIHYTFDNVKGYDCGIAVGDNVENLKW